MAADREEHQQRLTEKNKNETKTSQGNKNSCWMMWLRCCQRINIFFQQKFMSLGYLVSRYPKIFLCVGLVLPILCMTGFLRYYTIFRVEQLYIPQSSQSIKDLDRAQVFFNLKIKTEEFILQKHDGSNILDDFVFEEALEIHCDILSISGLEDICAKHPLHSKGCITLSPLEMFHYQKSNLVNVSTRLNVLFEQDHFILSNGRPAKYSFREFFADFEYDSTTKEIKRASGLRNIYFVKYAEDDESHQQQMEWEDRYMKYISFKQEQLNSKGLKILFTAGKSLDESVSESSERDITLIPISFGLMILFCTFTLAKFRNVITGHFWLANGGILALALGIGSAFAFAMLIGTPYVAFAGVLPFLILGIGIDNIFIITDCIDRQDVRITGSDRIAKSFGHVGASITMTTLTDLVAFAISTVTDFPAIKYFCVYAALSITFCYLLVVSVFMAMLTYDVKRIEEGRLDFIPCCKPSKKNEESCKKTRNNVASEIMRTYGTFLMKVPVKVVVIILSLSLLIAGILGSVKIDQSFDMLDLGLKDSEYVKFYAFRNDHYPSGFAISVIIDRPIDYENPDIQKSYSELDKIADQNPYMTGFTLNWMSSLLEWSSTRNISCSGKNFYPALLKFLKETPMYEADLRTIGGRRIIASRVIMESKDNHNSIFRKDMMLSLREDISNTNLPAYPIHMMFIYIEQFVIILRDTIRNLVICSAAILFIMLPYLIHPTSTFLVFFGFVSLIFELLGLMYIWDVSLNSISMIVIVMAIGFAVDYSAHIAHAFMVSKAATPESRVIDSLSTMGSSVLMGGTSTFIGMIVTSFAKSEIFKIFFKMVLGIVVLGLIHGLLFLPVFLSVFCRTDLRIPEEDENEHYTENGNSDMTHLAQLSPYGDDGDVNGETTLVT